MLRVTEDGGGNAGAVWFAAATGAVAAAIFNERILSIWFNFVFHQIS